MWCRLGVRGFMLRFFLLFVLLISPLASFAGGSPVSPFSWGGFTFMTYPDGSTGHTVDLGFPLLPEPWTLGGLTVQTTGPEGFSHTFTDADLSTWMGESELWHEFASLAPGLYTTTLSDALGNSTTRTDLVALPRTTPIVDTGTIQYLRKSNGAYRFSWAPVVSERPYYYRLTVLDEDRNSVYSGARKFDVIEEVPPGILQDGNGYRARVEVHDASNFDLLNNRSNSGYIDFTPQAADYSPSRLLFNYAYVANRIDGAGPLSTDINFSVGAQAISSATVTGPDGFSYEFDTVSDRLPTTDFYKNFSVPLATGAYRIHVVANGIDHYAYATLSPATALPAVDEGRCTAQNLGNGYVRFSWVDADRTGALYYRVMVRDSVSGLLLASPRVHQTFVDMPLSQLNTLNSRVWRVEFFDSSSGSAVRNRRNGSYQPLSIKPYDAASLVPPTCQISHLNNYSGADMTYLAAWSESSSLSRLTIEGPGGFSRDLLAANDYLEQGSPAPGLYTCTAGDAEGRMAVSYNYQPAAAFIPPVDFRSVSVSTLSNGDVKLSWAAVPSELPLWYGVEFYETSRVDGVMSNNQIYLPLYPLGYFLSQTSVVIPAQYVPAYPFTVRIFAFDGGSPSTFNNYSRSVAFGFSGAGFDYASLTDADANGFASNVTLKEDIYTVSVQTTGTGGGTVSSIPSGITCSSGSASVCSATLAAGSVTLTPAADPGSRFDGWQGACVNASGDCTFTLGAASSVSAIFNRISMVRLASSIGTPFSLIQPAYQAAASEDGIKSRSGVFEERLVFDRPVSLRLNGGFDPNFGLAAGVTRVRGSLVVRSGKLTVDRIAVF